MQPDDSTRRQGNISLDKVGFGKYLIVSGVQLRFLPLNLLIQNLLFRRRPPAGIKRKSLPNANRDLCLKFVYVGQYSEPDTSIPVERCLSGEHPIKVISAMRKNATCRRKYLAADGMSPSIQYTVLRMKFSRLPVEKKKINQRSIS